MKIRNREIIITPELYEEILIESNHLYDFLDCSAFTYRTTSKMFLNKIGLRINAIGYSRTDLIRKVINVLYSAMSMDSFKTDIEKLGFPDYYKMKRFYSE